MVDVKDFKWINSAPYDFKMDIKNFYEEDDEGSKQDGESSPSRKTSSHIDELKFEKSPSLMKQREITLIEELE